MMTPVRRRHFDCCELMAWQAIGKWGAPAGARAKSLLIRAIVWGANGRLARAEDVADEKEEREAEAFAARFATDAASRVLEATP